MKPKKYISILLLQLSVFVLTQSDSLTHPQDWHSQNQVYKKMCF